MNSVAAVALDPARIPAHIAVIMDGNGRWAEQRGLPRAAGHRAGIEAVRALIQTSNDLGVRYLTIYSFSTENWSRPLQEVKTLMSLFARTMQKELSALDAKGVRVRVIGDRTRLPQHVNKVYDQAIATTADNTGMTLVVAANYGARDEIAAAARRIAERALAGELGPEELAGLNGDSFSAYLETSDIPDPDLLIRTSGEYRLSNFLLYQAAYSELYISETLWPDFDATELMRAIAAYQARQRRFGGLS
ncbi:MAG: isoprenyl transferase [Coriobacteriales bacterium]|jgi:undecaprenyl diphosphate synthase|nr:isoprenyl transferase [Coriobacteriales bacterium]